MGAPAAGPTPWLSPPHAQRFIAADISQEKNLDECVRQVRATCTTPVETRRIDLACPEQATVGLAGSCDVFLCLYVIELTTGANAVRAILKNRPHRVGPPGGMALVQIKYHTSDRRTRGFAGTAYDRNLASTTTFTIEEFFWNLAAECGLTPPRLITLVPEKPSRQPLRLLRPHKSSRRATRAA